MLILGIDNGTQSTKTIVLDPASGEILASASKSYGLIPDLPPGHLEQDPQIWLEAADETIQACLQKLGNRRDEIAAIGVSGQQHGLVVLDEAGEVVRPAKLWCDTSTVKQCEQFGKEFGGARGLIELAGNAMLPGYTAPKILWLKENEPVNFAAADAFLLPHDYLNYWLTGEQFMEYGDASGTALLDVRTRKWCEPLCEFIDKKVLECLPEPQSSRKPAGLLREELRVRWGLKRSVIVSAGGGDNMMGAIGTGNLEAGIVTASFGTSGTLYSYATKPVVDAAGEVAAFCDSTGAWLPLVCTMNVTVATEQVRKLFGWSFEQVEQEIAGVRPGADGLLFLPYLTGERTPNLPEATGVLHGLTPRNYTAANLARATMEGATLGLAYGLKRFRELGIVPREIRLTGGGSKSAVWRQISADIFGASTVCLHSAEGAALGAAVQAAWCYGVVNNEGYALADLSERLIKVDESTRAEPDKDRTEFYSGLLSRHTDLTRKLERGGFL